MALSEPLIISLGLIETERFPKQDCCQAAYLYDRSFTTEVSVPNSHLKELDSRLSRHHLSPGRLLTLEEFQQRIQARK